MTAHFTVLFLAILLDRLVGDPPALWRRLTHPVAVAGAVIGRADEAMNLRNLTPRRKRLHGVLFLTGSVFVCLLLGMGLSAVFSLFGPIGWIAEIVLVAVFLSQKSLLDHVGAVATALREEGVRAGQREVAKIVGRDVSQLGEAGIARAAIESLAENTSDGIVAPIVWYLFLGLPGLLMYKFVNTADSMIGHMNDTHRDFGWASARFDDLLNVLPARATAYGFLLLGRGGRIEDTVSSIVRPDARRHRSVNAGWPESAMAVCLGVALGGPRRYGDLIVDAQFLNEAGRRSAGVRDIEAGIRLVRRLFGWLLALAGALAASAALLG